MSIEFEEVFYTDTKSVKVFQENYENNNRTYWYIHQHSPEIGMFGLDDEKAFTTLKSITTYILQTIRKESLKINKESFKKFLEFSRIENDLKEKE